jgi:hypothetical protein
MPYPDGRNKPHRPGRVPDHDAGAAAHELPGRDLGIESARFAVLPAGAGVGHG